MFRICYRWTPRNFFRIADTMWRDVRNGIYNVVRWIPVIWFDEDFDWDPLADILEYKFKRMSKLFRDHGHTVGSARHARQLAECAALLSRLRDDNYMDIVEAGRGVMSRDCVRLAASIQKHDQARLGKLIGKYFTHWWD